LDFRITGLDAQQRHLAEMQDAFARLDGEIGTVTFDLSDAASLEDAVCRMEKLIDEKTQPYSGNPTVMDVREALKQKYSALIRRRTIRGSVAVSHAAFPAF
jgi:hypothetical protein